MDEYADEWRCAYPDQCCMPGPHHVSECHTAEMLDAEREELMARIEGNHSAEHEEAVEDQSPMLLEDMGYGDADDGIPF